MSLDLTIESLKEMNKADYIKAFKNKSLWKKAKAVIFLIDYKLDGKKNVVAIPFLKEADMKAKMKEIKKNKIHLMKKTGGGVINVENDGPEGLKAKVELKLGGLASEILQNRAVELFDKIKAKLEVAIAPDAEMESSETDEDTENDEQNDSSEIQYVANETDNAELQKKIKITIAKIAQLNKSIDLKAGLKDTDVQIANEIKNLVREFATFLKNATADIKNEFAETFLKTKKIFAVIEDQLKKLKEKQAASEQLERALEDTLNSDQEEDDESGELQNRNEAISKNRIIMQEINDLMKEINFAAL
jgi:hypothetical protein